VFPAKRLNGAIEPPRVLKPQDFDQMNCGNNQWRPQTSFVPSNKVALLGDPGHRMLGYVYSLKYYILY
jgi:5'-3' exoribonuclease 2